MPAARRGLRPADRGSRGFLAAQIPRAARASGSTAPAGYRGRIDRPAVHGRLVPTVAERVFPFGTASTVHTTVKLGKLDPSSGENSPENGYWLFRVRASLGSVVT